MKQYIPDYPFGPVYEITFSEGDIPFACLPPEWVFALRGDTDALRWGEGIRV